MSLKRSHRCGGGGFGGGIGLGGGTPGGGGGGGAAFVPGGIRFSYVTLAEPPKAAMRAYLAGEGPVPARQAEVIATIVPKMDAYVFVVNLGEDGASVASKSLVPEGCQPLFSPDDCFLAEEIVKADVAVCAELAERYGVDPADFGTSLVCDP